MCEVLYLISLMPPSSRPSDRGYVTRKCWRSWPRMTWKLSPRSLLWLTSAIEPPRAVHGTRPHKPGLPSWAARVPPPGTRRIKRRRIATTRSRDPPLWSLQLRRRAGATTTNANGCKGVAVARALYTPTIATASRSAARSLISRNASANVSASGVSSLPRTAPHLVVVVARKRSTTAR
jgi:hypothetical protein